MKKILLAFLIVFMCGETLFAAGESSEKYVFNQYKVQSELENKDATFDSVAKLLDGITDNETESGKMRRWFKNWLIKQNTLNWNAVRAIVEHGGFAALDDDVLRKYLDVSCFDGVGDSGWDSCIDYMVPYFDDKFHFSLSVKLANVNDRDKTICVLGKLAKYVNYTDLGEYKETAITYNATNMISVFDELENEMKKMKSK